MLNLITKLYEKKYGCQPTNEVDNGAAPDAPKESSSKEKDKKKQDDDGISDDYDDDFDTDLLEDKKKADIGLAAVKVGGLGAAIKKDNDDDEEEEDDWGMDDDWGDLDDLNDNNKGAKKDSSAANNVAGAPNNAKKASGKPTTIMDDLDGLDDLPEIGSNFPPHNNKNEDKFNQVMSSSKEGGGLLASIGLKKEDMKEGADSIGDDLDEEDDDDDQVDEEEEDDGDSQLEGDPHKKSDLFDTSKDRVLLAGKKGGGGANAHQ